MLRKIDQSTPVIKPDTQAVQEQTHGQLPLQEQVEVTSTSTTDQSLDPLQTASSVFGAQRAIKNENAQQPQKTDDSLEASHQETFDKIMGEYKTLIDSIDARLRDPATSPEDKKKLVQHKKDQQGEVRTLKAKYPAFATAGAREGQLKKMQELIEQIPEESRNKFSKLIQDIPEELQAKYIKTLEGILGNKDEVAVRTTMRGLVFELSRIHTLTRQGLEKVSFDLKIPQEVEYVGFAKTAKDFNQKPTQKFKSPIQFDIPVIRNGEPYVYEAKSYPRMQFGSLSTQRNQLLKYQTAIEQGVVEGVTVEIKGRIDPNFLKWASGTNIAEAGRIPDVEIIYTFDLPSGAEHRFVLKRSRKNNGLNFQNEGRSTTPEATLRSIKEDNPDQYKDMVGKFGSEEGVLNKLAEDRKVINGIQSAVLDRSIVDILASVDIENPPQELHPHLADPMTIKSADLFDQYETLRKESIYEKLLAKREIINVDNKLSSYSEFATRDYVERSLREYQDYLKQNPEMAKVKKAYILNGEEAIQAVVDKVMNAVEKVRDFELQRMHAEKDPNNLSRKERTKMGYSGQPEGVALDIEHITMDTIQEVNKKSRSYENPEQFNSVEKLKEDLPNEDRRYLEIAIYDPMSGKTERNIDVNETHIKQTSAKILKENIKRAEERVQQIVTRFEELNQKTDKTHEDSGEMKSLAGRLRAKEMQARNIETIKAQIETLRSEKVERVKAEKDNFKKNGLASEYNDRIAQNMEELANLYKEVLGGEKEWDKVAKRISERIDQNMIKFIYVVNASAEVIVGEEIIRGKVSGRAAHSELAQGRNVYGAGELVFTKDVNGQWTLTEINNGSGHYRPSVLTLPYVKNLLKLKGVDTSRVEIRDTLLRGTPPPELTLLEE